MTQITPTSVGPVVIHGACFLTSFLTVWGLHGGDVIDGPGHEVCSVHSFHIGLKWGCWPFLKPSANLGFARIYWAGYGFGHKTLSKKHMTFLPGCEEGAHFLSYLLCSVWPSFAINAPLWFCVVVQDHSSYSASKMHSWHMIRWIWRVQVVPTDFHGC